MITRVLSLLAVLMFCQNGVGAQYNKCLAALCAYGTVCRETTIPCFWPPCPTQAVCEPVRQTRPPPVNKPGTCPGYQTRHLPTCRAQCSSDSSCPGSQKCCFSGCGMRCVSIQSTRPPPVNKPGTCPGYQTRHLPTCRAQCSSDSSCPGSQKCCFSGCGTRCVSIQSRPTVKPGTCPRAQYGVVTPCVVRCDSDSSCNGNLKCCSWGCSWQCMSPGGATNGKPGVCPWESYPWGGSRCSWRYDQCQSDYQCYGAQKCCRRTCGNTCVNPISIQHRGAEYTGTVLQGQSQDNKSKADS